MRAALAFLVPAMPAWTLAGLLSCKPETPAVDWTCDFDASETRPLSDPDAALGVDGSLPAAVCENTCGTPAHACTFILLEGGIPGAHCPVCTF